MLKCDFGCGKEARYQFKTGRHCCCKCANSCSAKREKDRLAKIGKLPSWKNGHPRGMLGKSSWSKGLTKETSLKLKTKAEALSQRFQSGELIHVPNIDTPEQKERRATNMRKNRIGGYQRKSGRGKHGWYKGYWCDSSWELAWVIYNLDHNIAFKRNRQKFPYTYESRQCNYVPDFILEDGTYVEVKGYRTAVVDAKIAAFPHKLIVLEGEKMKIYLNYVVDKYGRNYIDLYE